MELLREKTAVITGSTKGIGRGIALELAGSGARVMLNHRRSPEGGRAVDDTELTREMIHRLDAPEPLLCEADMTDEADVRRLADEAVEKLGRVDIWVNTVGLHIVTPALEQSLEVWERLYRINATSAFLGCREAARIMKPTGGGSIVNIASKMGIVGSAENACYCSAKASVIMMTKCLAAEWARFGLRVNVVAPGVTQTDPTYDVVRGKPALEAALRYRTPLGRFAEPEEIGKVVLFLASDLSSYITGAAIPCDGGWTAHSDFAGIPPDRLDRWREVL